MSESPIQFFVNEAARAAANSGVSIQTIVQDAASAALNEAKAGNASKDTQTALQAIEQEVESIANAIAGAFGGSTLEGIVAEVDGVLVPIAVEGLGRALGGFFKHIEKMLGITIPPSGA